MKKYLRFSLPQKLLRLSPVLLSSLSPLRLGLCLAGKIPAVKHQDGLDVVVEQQVDVLHHVLDVPVGLVTPHQLLGAAKRPLVEPTVNIDGGRAA